MTEVNPYSAPTSSSWSAKLAALDLRHLALLIVRLTAIGYGVDFLATASTCTHYIALITRANPTPADFANFWWYIADAFLYLIVAVECALHARAIVARLLPRPVNTVTAGESPAPTPTDLHDFAIFCIRLYGACRAVDVLSELTFAHRYVGVLLNDNHSPVQSWELAGYVFRVALYAVNGAVFLAFAPAIVDRLGGRRVRRDRDEPLTRLDVPGGHPS